MTIYLSVGVETIKIFIDFLFLDSLYRGYSNVCIDVPPPSLPPWMGEVMKSDVNLYCPSYLKQVLLRFH